MDAEEVPSQLVVLLELNPLSSSSVVSFSDDDSSERRRSAFSFSAILDAVLVFANAHLLLRSSNSLGLVVSHIAESLLLFPDQQIDPDVANCRVAERIPLPDGKYEHFARVNHRIVERLHQLALRPLSWNSLSEGEPAATVAAAASVGQRQQLATSSQLISSLSIALCHISKTRKALPANAQLQSRILVVQTAEDVPSQYIQLMNCIFAAQKLSVAIDALVLGDKDSGFLQQAADLTHGSYVRLSVPEDLMETLMIAFAADGAAREWLSLPKSTTVDYRSACFCHKQIVDVGFVCSVCLSIFCEKRGVCATCGTRFKVPGSAAARK